MPARQERGQALETRWSRPGTRTDALPSWPAHVRYLTVASNLPGQPRHAIVHRPLLRRAQRAEASHESGNDPAGPEISQPGARGPAARSRHLAAYREPAGDPAR